jgi:hypothetical protein
MVSCNITAAHHQSQVKTQKAKQEKTMAKHSNTAKTATTHPMTAKEALEHTKGSALRRHQASVTSTPTTEEPHVEIPVPQHVSVEAPITVSPEGATEEQNKDVKDTKVFDFDAEDFIKKHGTKSAAIRALRAEGKEVKDISKLLGIRYQHVRNVLMQMIGAKVPSAEEVKAAESPTSTLKTPEDNEDNGDGDSNGDSNGDAKVKVKVA